MTLPYVQLDTDFIQHKAATIAAILRVPRQLVVGMGADLFNWVVPETGTDARPPDGVILDPEAPAIIEGVMGWAGEPGKAFDAFVRAGAIEKLEVGARIKGCERYARTWEKNNRRKPAEKMPVTGEKPAAECRSSLSTSLVDSDSSFKGGAGGKNVPAQVEPPDSAADGWSGEEFWAWAQAKRQESRLVPERQMHHSKLSAWWSSARMVASAEDMQEAFYRFGEDEYWQQRKPPLPFQGFVSQWEKYMPQLEAKSA